MLCFLGSFRIELICRFLISCKCQLNRFPEMPVFPLANPVHNCLGKDICPPTPSINRQDRFCMCTKSDEKVSQDTTLLFVQATPYFTLTTPFCSSNVGYSTDCSPKNPIDVTEIPWKSFCFNRNLVHFYEESNSPWERSLQFCCFTFASMFHADLIFFALNEIEWLVANYLIESLNVEVIQRKMQAISSNNF